MRFCFSKADDRASRPVGRNLDSACRAKVGLHKASPAKGVSRHSSPWQEGFLAAPCPAKELENLEHVSRFAIRFRLSTLLSWCVALAKRAMRLGTQNLKCIIYTFLEMSLHTSSPGMTLLRYCHLSNFAHFRVRSHMSLGTNCSPGQ